MPESDRGRHIIQTATGLPATVTLRNAGRGKSSYAKDGVSAVVQCVDPETGLSFEASATELRVMAGKAQGMTNREIADELEIGSPSSVSGAMDRVQLRLAIAGWETEGVPRRRFVTYAERLGLLDGAVLDKITEYIKNSPPALSVAERVRRHRMKMKEEAARRMRQ